MNRMPYCSQRDQESPGEKQVKRRGISQEKQPEYSRHIL